jgi:protoporphyrinogen oxidase
MFERDVTRIVKKKCEVKCQERRTNTGTRMLGQEVWQQYLTPREVWKGTADKCSAKPRNQRALQSEEDIRRNREFRHSSPRRDPDSVKSPNRAK